MFIGHQFSYCSFVIKHEKWIVIFDIFPHCWKALFPSHCEIDDKKDKNFWVYNQKQGKYHVPKSIKSVSKRKKNKC